MASATPPQRLSSIDTYRGLVMFLMLAEVLRTGIVASRATCCKSFWEFLAYQQSHVQWVGCTLHDLIQPSFSFLVGVALPFSLANRASSGQSQLGLALHALWRSILLIALGIFLGSLGQRQTSFHFQDTLSQIGMGYFALFLIGKGPRWLAWVVCAAILVGYWTLFALYPLPAEPIDLRTMGQKTMAANADFKARNWQEGFAGHWNINANAATQYDRWFLNLFPRNPRDKQKKLDNVEAVAKDSTGQTPILDPGLDADGNHVFNTGGYQTLNFIPTLATMLLGLITGRLLREDWSDYAKIRWLVLAGVIGLGSGWLLGALGICPVVKRIWTPSWVLFSGGWCFLFTAGFFWIVDVLGYKSWAFPLIVIGMNSITAYCLARVDLATPLLRHLGDDTFELFGWAYQPIVLGATVLLLRWLILYWMYRNRVFIRI